MAPAHIADIPFSSLLPSLVLIDASVSKVEGGCTYLSEPMKYKNALLLENTIYPHGNWSHSGVFVYKTVYRNQNGGYRAYSGLELRWLYLVPA